jgi:hypothetical protein
MERIPLSTPYPEVVARINQTVRAYPVNGNCQLVVDATGVGPPVVDMLRAQRMGCHLIPVNITTGNNETLRGSNYHVPKSHLIMELIVLFENEQIKIAAKMKEAQPLVEELVNMQRKVSTSGQATYTARSGQHDDMVLALSLACWRARRTTPWRTQ